MHLQKITSFLRHVGGSQLVWIAKRLIQCLVPAKPYPMCGRSPRCPCPAARKGPVTGVAIGDEVTMNLK